MSEDENQGVPSLGGAPVMSKSVQKRLAAQRGRQPEEFAPPAPPAPEPPVAAPVGRTYARWRLLEDFELHRGASTVTMEAGLVLSEQHYDVGGLQRKGARLERLAD